MRLTFTSLVIFVLGLSGLVSAKSAVGDRILVVLEDGGEKNLYSQFWADLECMFALAMACERTVC